MQFEITCITAGASGTVEGQGVMTMYNGTSPYIFAKPIVNTGVVTVDTTAAQTLQISATWGTSNAANTIQMRQMIVESGMQ
jgi:cytoskeletal protein CcmA (bactofilin family)